MTRFEQAIEQIYAEGRQNDVFNSILEHLRWEGDCLVWQRGRNVKTGYGQMNLNFPDRQVRCGVHRAVYALLLGPIPKGMHVLHSCDNPPCANIRHLRLGTVKDNMLDKVRKGRAQTRLTPELVREIRERRASGERYVDIAKGLDLPYPLVHRVGIGDRWKWVE